MTELEIQLTCTMCHTVKEMHCQIVYSQGDRVCLDCKKITLAGDNRAFDNYINSRSYEDDDDE